MIVYDYTSIQLLYNIRITYFIGTLYMIHTHDSSILLAMAAALTLGEVESIFIIGGVVVGLVAWFVRLEYLTKTNTSFNKALTIKLTDEQATTSNLKQELAIAKGDIASLTRDNQRDRDNHSLQYQATHDLLINMQDRYSALGNRFTALETTVTHFKEGQDVLFEKVDKCNDHILLLLERQGITDDKKKK